MKLLELVTKIDGCETIHIIDEIKEDTVYYGKVREAYLQLDEHLTIYGDIGEEIFRTFEVSRIFNGFGGLCIEIKKP